jgi:hypothetical protein
MEMRVLGDDLAFGPFTCCFPNFFRSDIIDFVHGSVYNPFCESLEQVCRLNLCHEAAWVESGSAAQRTVENSGASPTSCKENAAPNLLRSR